MMPYPRHYSVCCEPASRASRAVMSLLGRKAAGWALQLAGSEFTNVERDLSGSPIWPQGFTGSISHTEIGSEIVAVAVVGSSRGGVTLGIDLEWLQRPFDLRIWRRIVTSAEAQQFPDSPSVREVLTVFTAKEALYKALFPRLRRFIGFREVEIAWDRQRSEGLPLELSGYSQPLPFLCAGSACALGESVDVTIFADDQLILASVLCA